MLEFCMDNNLITENNFNKILKNIYKVIFEGKGRNVQNIIDYLHTQEKIYIQNNYKVI